MRRIFDAGDAHFARCGRCGSWFQAPQIDAKSLALWVDSPEYRGCGRPGQGPYADYLADEEARRRDARERYVRDLAPLLAKGSRVLEVGCATGSLLSILRDAGHDAVGVDLSEEFARFGRERYGLTIHRADFLETSFEPSSFDLIAFLGTISNLADLPAHLAHAHRLLRAGGWLYFNQAVADSGIARLYGPRHWMFAPSVSVFLSREGCRLALRGAGFDVVRARVDRQRPTTGKSLMLARGGSFLPLARQLSLDRWAPPRAIPIPGMRAVWARKRAGTPRRSPGSDFLCIVGAPRSGTFLLAALLQSELGCATPYETHFIPLFYRARGLWGDLRRRADRRRLLDCVYGFLRVWTRNASMGRDIRRLWPYTLMATEADRERAADQAESFASVVHHLFREYAARHGMRLWSDKCHSFYPPSLRDLDRALQGLRAIHIIRDGRDVCLSWRKGWYGPLTVAEAARVWGAHVREYRGWGRKHPERYLEVRYEDLLDDPRAAIGRIARFLESPWSEREPQLSDLEYATVISEAGPHGLLAGPVVAGNKDKWRRLMPEADRRLFERVAGSTLSACGYPREGDPATRWGRPADLLRIAASWVLPLVSIRHLRLRLKALLPFVLLAAARLPFLLEAIVNLLGAPTPAPTSPSAPTRTK